MHSALICFVCLPSTPARLCAGALCGQEALESLARPSLHPQPYHSCHITAHIAQQSILPQHQTVLQPLTVWIISVTASRGVGQSERFTRSRSEQPVTEQDTNLSVGTFFWNCSLSRSNRSLDAASMGVKGHIREWESVFIGLFCQQGAVLFGSVTSLWGFCSAANYLTQPTFCC